MNSGIAALEASQPRRVLISLSTTRPAPPKIFSTFVGPTESNPPKEKSFFPLWKDPVPDAPIDYTELWKVVSMAKSDAAKSNQTPSNKGTEAYGSVLHRLGIDIDKIGDEYNPEDVINLSDYQ